MRTPATREHIADTAVSTADEFFTVLSPRTGDWGGAASKWVFRGQADANWKLLPSAMRAVNSTNPFGQVGVRDSQDMQKRAATSAHWSLRVDRLNLMLDFLEDALNDQGLAIPADSPATTRRMRIEANSLPVREMFPLMALAQHHCLPTLFLDWTRRAWVAAYFAAVGAATALKLPRKSRLSGAKRATHLAVWALRRNEGREDGSLQPYFYEAPANTNPNLRAQSGLFTWWISDGTEDLSLDEYIAWLARKWNRNIGLRRFLLPVIEAPRLLRLLALEHINGATMFPGVDGIVRAMRERTLWDDWEDAAQPADSAKNTLTIKSSAGSAATSKLSKSDRRSARRARVVADTRPNRRTRSGSP